MVRAHFLSTEKIKVGFWFLWYMGATKVPLQQNFEVVRIKGLFSILICHHKLNVLLDQNLALRSFDKKKVNIPI